MLMKKETLTLSNVKLDLIKVAYDGLSRAEDWRLSFFVSTAIAVALVLMLVTWRIWPGLLFLPFIAYHVIRYIISFREYKKQKKEIETAANKGYVSVSLEKLSHIATETIIEPYFHHYVGFARGRMDMTKEIGVYYFMSGASWRVPFEKCYDTRANQQHYEWSKELCLSSRGLDNISLPGDEFFYITLQGYPKIAYIYPCKFFELGKDLKK